MSVCLSLSPSLSLSQPFVLFMLRPLSCPEISSFTCRARWQIKTPSTTHRKELLKRTYTYIRIYTNSLSPSHTHSSCNTLCRRVVEVLCCTEQQRTEEETEHDLKTSSWSFLLFLNTKEETFGKDAKEFVDCRDPGDHHFCTSVLFVIECGGDYHGKLSRWISMVTISLYLSLQEKDWTTEGVVLNWSNSCMFICVFNVSIRFLQKANAAGIILCGN